MANLVNREAVQKLCAASYLDDYLDCMQNLPNQLQPYLSRIRELDVESARFMKQIEHLKAQLGSVKNGGKGKETTESSNADSASVSTDDGIKDDSEDSADAMSYKKDGRNDSLRRSLEVAMEELGDLVQQKLAAARKMAEIVDARRRMLDDGVDNLHNCDQADASLFSSGISPNFGRSRSSQAEKRASPPRATSGGSSSPPTSICGDNRNGRSDQSFDSSGEQEVDELSEAESTSRSAYHSSTESEADDKMDDKDSDDTGAERQNRGADSARRGRIGRPPRSRGETNNTRLAKSKQNERAKTLVPSVGRSKLDRRAAQVQDRHNRSSRQTVTSRRQKQDSISESQTNSGVGKGASSLNRVGGASGNKGNSSQRGNRGNNNNNGGSSSASFVADVADSMDQEADEQLYCICKQVSYGEMVGCDNNNCPMQWFHFSCVNLSTKPKGRWFCPGCRGDKPNVKRADLR